MRWLFLGIVTVISFGCERAERPSPPIVERPPTTFAQESPEAAPGPPQLGDVVLWHGAEGGDSWIAGLAPRDGREPIGLDVDGDGVEEAIGFLGGAGRGAHIFPAVIDASAAQPRWVGPAPTLTSSGGVSEHGVYIQAIRGKVLVTTTDGRAVAYDAKTGIEKASLDLNARAANTCVVTGGLVRIDQENDVHFDFDPETATFKEVATKCPTATWRDRDEARSWVYGGGDSIEFHMRLPDGHIWKGVDKRTRTVHVHRAAGRGGTPIWSTKLGDDEVVALPGAYDFHATEGGDVFVDFERGVVGDRLEWPAGTGEYYVVKLDAKTGAVQWISTVPKKSGGASGWLVTKTHLWISRHTQLDVFDRSTGKHLGYVGWR